MVKIKSIAFGLALSLAATASLAAPHGNHGHQLSGGYAGFGIGDAKLSGSDDVTLDEDLQIRAYLGYQLNRYFAVEAGLNSLELDDLLGNVADLSGLDVSVLATLPISSRLSAYARAGYWYWDIGTEYYSLLDDTDPLYGIGVDFKVSPRVKLRLDATRYEIGESEIDTISGNITYNF